MTINLIPAVIKYELVYMYKYCACSILQPFGLELDMKGSHVEMMKKSLIAKVCKQIWKDLVT